VRGQGTPVEVALPPDAFPPHPVPLPPQSRGERGQEGAAPDRIRPKDVPHPQGKETVTVWKKRLAGMAVSCSMSAGYPRAVGCLFSNRA